MRSPFEVCVYTSLPSVPSCTQRLCCPNEKQSPKSKAAKKTEATRRTSIRFFMFLPLKTAALRHALDAAIRSLRLHAFQNTRHGTEVQKQAPQMGFAPVRRQSGITIIFSDTETGVMARKWASATVLKAVFNLCFIALFFQVLAFAEWIFASSMT